MKLGPYSTNTIVCKDCKNVLAHLPSDCIDLVVTSPPYADMVDYGDGRPVVTTLWYPTWFSKQVVELLRVCKPSAAFVLNIRDKVENGATSPYVLKTVLAMMEIGWRLWDTWFWIKNSPPTALASTKQRVMNIVEYVYIFCNKTPYFNADAIRRPYAPATLQRYKTIHHANVTRHQHEDKIYQANPKGAIPTNVLVYAPNYEVPQHPAVMSEKLAETLILALSRPKDLVLDPFLGTGTTARAAKRLARDYFGCDINEKFVGLAQRRVAEVKQTGLGLF